MNYLRQPESLVCEITESQNPDIHAAKRIRELVVPWVGAFLFALVQTSGFGDLIGSKMAS